MELFSVTCITCRAKLKVRHESAIGQILPCPRCNGMVQIQAPPGWKPPVRVEPTPTDAAPVARSSIVSPPVPPPLTAVLADDPLAPPSHAAVPAEARARRWIVVGGIAAAAAIVGFGLWSTFGGGESSADPIAAAPEPSATAAPPKSSPTPTAAVVSPADRAKVAEALKKPIELRFERDALVYILENIGAEIGVPIEIIGEDLQADGITKNQSMGMSEGPWPAAVMLRKVLIKANPAGQLVFQVKPRPADGRPIIYIATRGGVAGRNESIAPEFDMPEPLGPVVVAPKPSPTPPTVKPWTDPAVALQKKIAMSFERNDLNKVLALISQEIDVPIEFIPDDLLRAGVTKNQSMGLSEPEQPAAKLLQTILMKANPDGNLIYQIKPRKPGEPNILFIGTRQGAAKRNEPLLPEFVRAAPAAPPVAVASASAPPPVVPSATKPAPVAPPAVAPPSVPPATIDLAARLQDKLPELAFDGTPLHQVLALISQLSTIRINYDWDSPAVAAAVRRPITVKLADVTIADALAQVLAPCELTTMTVGDQLLVTAAKSSTGSGPAEYVVDDLVVAGVVPPERLVQLVEEFVAPESWRSAGGQATIVADGAKLRVVQTVAVHREIEAFLDRLRKARGKTPKNPATSLATRFAANRDVLDKPISMNFRPGAPLETVLAHLQGMTGAVFTVDYPALMSAGYQVGEPIGAAADKHALADVLSAICSPREWSWRIVGDQAVELTTREGMRRRLFVEFYKVPASMATPAAAQGLIERIRNQLADEGWHGLGGRGDITYDEPSAMLIVRQHQEAQTRLERALLALTQMEAGDGAAKPAAIVPQPAATARPPAVPKASPTGSATASPPAAR